MRLLQLYLAIPFVFVLGCGEPGAKHQTAGAGNSTRLDASVAKAGIDAKSVDALAAKLGSRECKLVDSMLILIDGEIIFEWYQNGYGPKQVHDIASITKSVTSLLIGIAIDRGQILSVDEKVVDYFRGTPYAKSWPEDKRSITIRHLLTMQHGIAFDDYDDPNMKRFKAWLNSDDRIAHVLQQPMAMKPGQKSTYCTASTQLLQNVIEHSTGQSVEKFARENLFDPLGIQSFKWERSPTHGIGMGFGADARPRDLALLGRMIEQRGKWNGRQIVSSNWLEESFRPRGKLLGIDYGYLWYGEPYSVDGKQIQSQLAMGHGGQFLVLFPDLQSILVITAKDYNQTIDFYRLIHDFVIPICSKT